MFGGPTCGEDKLHLQRWVFPRTGIAYTFPLWAPGLWYEGDFLQACCLESLCAFSFICSHNLWGSSLLDPFHLDNIGEVQLKEQDIVWLLHIRQFRHKTILKYNCRVILKMIDAICLNYLNIPYNISKTWQISTTTWAHVVYVDCIQ